MSIFFTGTKFLVQRPASFCSNKSLKHSDILNVCVQFIKFVGIVKIYHSFFFDLVFDFAVVFLCCFDVYLAEFPLVSFFIFYSVLNFQRC